MNKSNILNLIDLTLLKATDSPEQEETLEEIQDLCERAISNNTAAICCYPYWVSKAKELLKGSDIKIATVANFPSGKAPIQETLHTIQQAIKDGANEIDVVLPYHYLLNDQLLLLRTYLKACRTACKDICLKVIIETGELGSDDMIELAAELCIKADIDFIKTSTGKTAQGASLSAAKTILDKIKSSMSPVGLKLSGGIRSWEQVEEYLALAKQYNGESWLNKEHLRFGMSKLPN